MTTRYVTSGPALCIAITLAFLAAGCASSSRFVGGDAGPPTVRSSGAVYNAPAEPFDGGGEVLGEPEQPRGRIVSEPLPPVAGTAPPADGFYGADGAIVSEPNVITQEQPLTPGPGSGAGTNVARLEEPRTAAPVSASPLAAVGSWSARDGTGASCRVRLTSTPSLDLYRASTTGCANKDLAGVNAWENRDGELYLYQPGGSVVARLRPGSAGYQGVLTKSGASVSLAR